MSYRVTNIFLRPFGLAFVHLGVQSGTLVRLIEYQSIRKISEKTVHRDKSGSHKEFRKDIDEARYSQFLQYMQGKGIAADEAAALIDLHQI